MPWLEDLKFPRGYQMGTHNLFLAITTSGITTFVLSFVCVLFGKKLGCLFEKYAEYLGGIILILLGIKILIEHLFF